MLTSVALASTNAIANQVAVTLDTTSLSGMSAHLAFDLVDGDGVSNNSLTISNFASDGILGASTASGGVAGSLPGAVTISDTEFFNELLQGITLGSSLSFMLDFTDFFAGGLTPDAFSFFILDDTGTNSLVTTDLLGDALLVGNYSGTGAVSVEWAASTSPSVPISVVPEPSTLPLLVACWIFLALWRKRPVSIVSSGLGQPAE